MRKEQVGLSRCPASRHFKCKGLRTLTGRINRTLLEYMLRKLFFGQLPPTPGGHLAVGACGSCRCSYACSYASYVPSFHLILSFPVLPCPDQLQSAHYSSSVLWLLQLSPRQVISFVVLFLNHASRHTFLMSFSSSSTTLVACNLSKSRTLVHPLLLKGM